MATSPPRPVQGWRSAESRTAPHRHSGRRTESRSRCHLNGPNVPANRRADFRVLVECKVRHRMLQQHRAFAPLVRYAAILYCQTYPPRETLFCSIDTQVLTERTCGTDKNPRSKVLREYPRFSSL